MLEWLFSPKFLAPVFISIFVIVAIVKLPMEYKKPLYDMIKWAAKKVFKSKDKGGTGR